MVHGAGNYFINFIVGFSLLFIWGDSQLGYGRKNTLMQNVYYWFSAGVYKN